MQTHLFDVRGGDEPGLERSSADPILVLISFAEGRGFTPNVEGPFPVRNEGLHDGEGVPFQALFNLDCTHHMSISYVHIVCAFCMPICDAMCMCEAHSVCTYKMCIYDCMHIRKMDKACILICSFRMYILYVIIWDAHLGCTFT